MNQITPAKQSKHFAGFRDIQLKHALSKLSPVDNDITAARHETKESEMLKKTMIAAALASAAMLAFAGSASAGKGHGFHAPAAKHFGKVAPKSFKLAHKRKFQYGRHFHHWNNWHYRPHRGCHWLKRKARWSGKRYWWKRYYQCRSHYYY